ncbi:hypothetical protein OTK49_03370 [Vibrio coralliirubri]|uniref:hypothetical protein n=1 Tax=Vibrio coralliirubri TaxID=1516159 RepID=UPI00228534CB|nr:hypothetical protein [Vibrio coralliirubri]MCY9861557.1 hypothetical protein [Vibrio coralliirubri]
MNVQEIISYAEEHDLSLLLMDGFDDCIIGITNDEIARVVYSEEKILLSLTAMLGSFDDAIDLYGHSIASAYVGERTPLIIRTEFD